MPRFRRRWTWPRWRPLAFDDTAFDPDGSLESAAALHRIAATSNSAWFRAIQDMAGGLR